MYTGSFAVIIDDHPVFGGHTVGKMVANQHDYIIPGLQMTDIDLVFQTLKTGKFPKMMRFI